MSLNKASDRPTITRFEIAKRVLAVLGLVGFMILGLFVIRSEPRTGWFTVALFGLMTLVGLIDLARLRNHRIVKGEGSRRNIRAAMVWSGTIALSVVIGVGATLLSKLAIANLPRVAIWSATFLSTLAFYPFRDKEDIPKFSLWAVYCALMGFVSIGLSYLERWMD